MLEKSYKEKIENYTDKLKKENIYIEEDKEILDVWQQTNKKDFVCLLPVDKISKEQSILGKIVYLWENVINKNKVGYFYDGLLKGKVMYREGNKNIFNSIKEYYDYYMSVISKEKNEKYIAKHGIEQKVYNTYEKYCCNVLSFKKDDFIDLKDKKKDEKKNLYICKKLLRIWKYKKLEKDDNISDANLIKVILELLPDTELRILEEYINVKEKKYIVEDICERMVKSNEKFALKEMKNILKIYKKEMEYFNYVEDEEYDPYYKLLKCVNFLEK